jgi:hypothetical protein
MAVLWAGMILRPDFAIAQERWQVPATYLPEYEPLRHCRPPDIGTLQSTKTHFNDAEQSPCHMRIARRFSVLSASA